jgi:hypothetical protein
MIEAYSDGQMTVRGQKHRRDLKIIGDRVVPGWWRNTGHRVGVNDVEDILAAAPDVVVVGTGYANNVHLDRDLTSRLEEQGIKLVAQETEAAVKTFNRLRAEGKNVAGAFHLTC